MPPWMVILPSFANINREVNMYTLQKTFNIETFEDKYNPKGKKARWPKIKSIWIHHKNNGETHFGEGITLDSRQAYMLAEMLFDFAEGAE